MSKTRPTTPTTREGSSARRDGSIGLGVRIVASVVILWHVVAVFMAGLSVPPSSPLASVIAQEVPMQWYLDMLAMNRGHHFFAPDPPPGVLVRYELVDREGKTIAGEFPDKKEYWPRLRYHRHFMLADQATVGAANENDRKAGTAIFLRAYGRHLLRVHNGQRVRVTRVIHRILDPPRFRPPEMQNWSYTHPKTYEVDLEVVVQRSEIEREAPRVGQVPQNQFSPNQRRPAGGWSSGVVR
jgi:hypothetical protein